MDYFFWIDCEMTGLDHTKDRLVELAAVVTDYNFTLMDTYHSVIFQPPEVLTGMDPVVLKMHQKSGLLSKIPEGRTIDVVDEALLAFINKYFKLDKRVVLCGNSVYNDKLFMDQYLPQVSQRLHYRLIDVSSWKEVFQKKYHQYFHKKNQHTALEDILESIAELSHYCNYIHLPQASAPAQPLS